MKTLLFAATALTMGGAALAYQTTPAPATTDQAIMHQQHHQAAPYMITRDPMRPMAVPQGWTAQQRAMWDEHMRYYPTHWTAQQRTAFQQMLTHPPAHWTADQQALWREHHANLPATWTDQQRQWYLGQMAEVRMPWAAQQQAAAGTATIERPAGWTDQQWQAHQDQQRHMEQWAGMGGPYEEVYGDGQVSLQPRPADTNYPPCRPGPGDDRCIQLYEPGVPGALANWQQPTGGLAPQYRDQTGMGGPLDDDELATDDYSAVGTGQQHAAYTGVGGPVEARTGYPPCAPGPGDDRCIQLYEPGVTGSGN